MASPEVKPLFSNGHFSVDGTLLQALISHASLERSDGEDGPPHPPSGPGEGFRCTKYGKKRAKGDFRWVRLSNKTHCSGTDPEALLVRKSHFHPAQTSYRGHVLTENRHGLMVDCRSHRLSATANGMEPRRWQAISSGGARKPSVPSTTTTPMDSFKKCDGSGLPGYRPECRPLRWLRHRWPHH